MKRYSMLICAGTLVLLSGSPCFALASWFPEKPGGRPTASHSAPGPVIGVGGSALVALGGYIWYRRRYRNK